MAAGMHDVWNFRFKRKACVLLNRQSVHVRTEKQEFPGLSAVNGCNDPGLYGAFLIGNADALQLSLHEGTRFELVERELRVFVDLVPERQGVLLQLVRQKPDCF